MRLGLFLILLVCINLSPIRSEPIESNDIEIEHNAGYIMVHNRSYATIRVYINGYDQGFLSAGYRYTWTVPAAICHKVEAWWQNGYYNVWQACPGYGQTIVCGTY